MVSDAELVLLFTALHVVGLGVLTALLVMFLRSETTDWAPPDEDDGSGGGGGGSDRLRPRAPEGPRGGLPLPDAVPARVRLRDHARLADHLPRPQRRPEPAPPSRRPRVPSAG